VNHELSFDKFHEKNDRLFQVMENERTDGTINTSGHTADFLAGALSREIPEVDYAAVVTPPNFFPAFTLSGSNQHVKGIGKFVDTNFFEIFSYDLVQGNPKQVLSAKTNVVISESLAKKLFSTTEDCIGKSIEWQLMDFKRQVIVSGIFKDVPTNSSEQFDFILTFDSFKDLFGSDKEEIVSSP
jgi:hypothetical protein